MDVEHPQGAFHTAPTAQPSPAAANPLAGPRTMRASGLLLAAVLALSLSGSHGFLPARRFLHIRSRKLRAAAASDEPPPGSAPPPGLAPAAEAAATGALAVAALQLVSHDVDVAVRVAALGLFALHVTSGALGATIAWQRDREVAPLGARALAGGPLALVSLMDLRSGEELELEEHLSGEPLSTVVHSGELGALVAPHAIVLSSTLIAKGDKVAKVARALERFAQEDVTCGAGEDVWRVAVNQDAQDRRCFSMLQKFPSVDAMLRHHTGAAFVRLMDEVSPMLEEPVGFYAVGERNGVFHEQVYPYGPGGEGGRDDAIFSSPSNLDGTQQGFKI